MQLSRFNKSFNVRKRLHSRSNHTNIQLPHINRTIDINSISHVRTESQNNFIEKYSWVLLDKHYGQLTDQEIYHEYEKLRKQIFKINDLVVKQLQKYQKNVQKKRTNTEFQTQRVNQVREREIQNNLSILLRMKKQYKGLKTKSQTITPKEDLQKLIQQTKNQINNVRKKINTIKLKNKDIGDSIIGTDQILIQLQQSQRQLEIWKRKKSQLQNKLQKVYKQQQQVSQGLSKLTPMSIQVDQFVRNQLSQKKNAQLTKKNFQTYQQKLNSIQILKRNIQVWTGVKQQKYHQLLKQLDNFSVKQTQIQGRINEVSLDTISAVDQIRNLQMKLKFIKQEKSKFYMFQKSIEDKIVQKSFNTIEKNSISSSKAKRNIKLNLVNLKQSRNLPPQKLVIKQQYKKSLLISSTQDDKNLIKNKINSIQQAQLQQEIPKNNHNEKSIKQKIKPELNDQKKNLISQKIKQNQLDTSSVKPKNIISKKKQLVKNEVKMKPNQPSNQNNIFNQIQRQIIKDKRIINNSEDLRIYSKSQQVKEFNQISRQKKLDEIKQNQDFQNTESKNIVNQQKKDQKKILQSTSNNKHTILQNEQNNQKEQNQLEQQMTGKFYINLGNIQKTIDQVTQSRIKAKKDLQTRISKQIFKPHQSVINDEEDLTQNQ